MNKLDIALSIYILFMAIVSFIGLMYGSNMIKKTGLFLPHLIISAAISFVLGVLGIIAWIMFSWGVNEFLFLGGLLLGVTLLIIGEALLFTVLFLKRRKLTQISDIRK